MFKQENVGPWEFLFKFSESLEQTILLV